MKITEIKAAILDQFPGSVLESEDLAKNQLELKADQWFEIATFMKEDPNLSFDQLECITGIDLGEEASLQSRYNCLLYTSPSPRDLSTSRMPSSA